MKVAFLGLGRMGVAMAHNLAKADLLATVWNRSDGKTDWCADAGVRVATSPADAAAGADVVILMLYDGDVTRAVAAEALPAMAAGSVLVDMGTSGPVAERDIARAAAERGVGFVDAPVSGSIALAQAATLTALVGGSAEDVEKVRPALAAMTRAQHHLGDVGAGATVKLALATMIAVTNQSVSELLVLCERAGLERAATYAALADSAVASPFVQYKQARVPRARRGGRGLHAAAHAQGSRARGRTGRRGRRRASRSGCGALGARAHGRRRPGRRRPRPRRRHAPRGSS